MLQINAQSPVAPNIPEFIDEVGLSGGSGVGQIRCGARFGLLLPRDAG